ncbi:hypothetical protein NE236_27955 [Actinoallomurus purpureus]|uniref:hypothetical protein n=1 Tax=Actinoallomurus purpureus TaxID=478114 RepID=UPI002093CA9A|nr:hypothetical protein [Actinoallomurus purpureus]MCO6008816.1 hypothetical protein [Actinoallomurus purpureus]
MAAAVVLALLSLYELVWRFKGGAQAGGWTVVYGMGLGFAGLSAELARRGRTRWAYAAFIAGALALATEDALP